MTSLPSLVRKADRALDRAESAWVELRDALEAAGQDDTPQMARVDAIIGHLNDLGHQASTARTAIDRDPLPFAPTAEEIGENTLRHIGEFMRRISR